MPHLQNFSTGNALVANPENPGNLSRMGSPGFSGSLDRYRHQNFL
jgi:hypothetical protein